MPSGLVKRLKDVMEQGDAPAWLIYDAIEALEAENARLKRERDEAFQKYVDANEARIEAEARRAKAVKALREFISSMLNSHAHRVDDYGNGYVDAMRNALDAFDSLAALAEPAGEAEPVGREPFIELPDGSYERTTPPDASAIRGAAIQLLSAIDTGCGREEIISQTGPLRAVLAGAKP